LCNTHAQEREHETNLVPQGRESRVPTRRPTHVQPACNCKRSSVVEETSFMTWMAHDQTNGRKTCAGWMKVLDHLAWGLDGSLWMEEETIRPICGDGASMDTVPEPGYSQTLSYVSFKVVRILFFEASSITTSPDLQYKFHR
jgi:hypothetical protein